MAATTYALAFAAVKNRTSGWEDSYSDSYAEFTEMQKKTIDRIIASAAVTAAGTAAPAGKFFDPTGIATGSAPAITSSDGNNSTPVITETYVSQINIPANCYITGVAIFNGTDVTGNITVGLATGAGVPVAAAKSASTAGSGTDAYQLIPFAALYTALGPATYFIQVQYSSGTARYNTHTIGTHHVMKQTSQTYGTLTSFTPPTTFVTNIGNMASLYWDGTTP